MLNDSDNDDVLYYSVNVSIPDMITYALGIGCCSDRDQHDDELKYVYENYEGGLEAFPTFLLSLGFRATPFSVNSNNKYDGIDQTCVGEGADMPSFPPPSMKKVYHELFNNGNEDDKDDSSNFDDAMSDIKALHISEEYQLHRPIPMVNENTYSGGKKERRIKIILSNSIINVTPRSIGTFVTTQTKYYYHLPTTISSPTNIPTKLLLATSQTITLWMGLFPKNKSYLKIANHMSRNDKRPILSKISFDRNRNKKHQYNIPVTIPINQALLYRMAGDTNYIHVLGLTDPTDEEKNPTPILHGLCTLAIVVRHLLQKQQSMELTFVSCQFTKPVLVGDTLDIMVTVISAENDTNQNLQFQVFKNTIPNQTPSSPASKKNNRHLVIKNGIVQLQKKSTRVSSTTKATTAQEYLHSSKL